MLVVAAGIFVTTAKLHSVSIGFNNENLLVFNLNAAHAGYDSTRAANFYEPLRRRFADIPRGARCHDQRYAVGAGSSNFIGISIPGLLASRDDYLRRT